MNRLWPLVALVAITLGEELKLTILHTNDIHARIDEFDATGGRCSSPQQCYGGIARQKYMVESIRTKNPNTLFLNTGDYYQGTMWFYLLKSAIISDTIKYLRHDAMTLGNHEFDDGSAGLFPLLYQANATGTPMLGCNVDFSKNPILRDFQPLPSIVLKRGGVDIGLIGFLTPDTRFLSHIDNGTILTDEIECIQREATKLRQRGVKIIIAMGHSGYLKDQEIASKIPLVRMVVGGHSHTYLSSVDQKQLEKPKGPYPTVITRGDKSKALVVQDYWLGKYLGYINVTFDSNNGEVRSWQGDSPLLLDATIPKDEEVDKFLKGKRQQIDSQADVLLGSSMYAVSGDKDFCRYGECALGNLLADAMFNYFATRLNAVESSELMKPIDIAVVNGGGIRGSLPAGNITFGDIVTIYPFANTIWVLPMTGEHIERMYENSFRKFDPKRLVSNGGFLHSSGVRIVADASRPPLKRIVSVKIWCPSCENWQDIDPKHEYRVAMTSYVAQGGDNHNFTNIPNERIQKLTTTDTDIAVEYVKTYSPLHPVVDGRLQILFNVHPRAGSGAAATTMTSTSFQRSLALLCSIVAFFYRASSIL